SDVAVLLKWFVNRDVPTWAPSSNGTIIPIPIPLFPLLVYLHSRKFTQRLDLYPSKRKKLHCYYGHSKSILHRAIGKVSPLHQVLIVI
ncbi:hypothetical protein CICLE_v10017542mg, partial [Citrus x clementina]